MLRLDVLQNQWLLVACGAGVVLVLAVVLYYLALWRERRGAGAEAGPARGKWRSVVPAVLTLIYVFTLAFMVIYARVMARHPPNW